MSISPESSQSTLLSLGGVRVSVTSRRIEDEARAESYDAVVSSDDTHLSMGGGVSQAILKIAGASVAREATSLVPLNVGDVAVTSAGDLPARYILHAITFDADRNIRPTERTIRFLGQNLFRRCESLQVRRLAIPAIGVGRAGFPAEQSIQLLLSSLARHSENPTVLQSVVFCVPDPEVRSRFKDGIGRTASSPLSLDDEFTADVSVPENEARVVPLGPPTAILAGPRRPSPAAGGSSEQETARLGRAPAADRGRPARGNRDPQLADASPAPAAARAAASLLERLKNRFGITGPIRLDLSRIPIEPIEHRRLDQLTTKVAPKPTLPERLLGGDARPLLSDRYVLLEELGRGGMGVVYLAWDVVLRQIVAIKTLISAVSAVSERTRALRREAALQIGLSHESIVRVLHFEPEERRVGAYIIMEFVPWVSGDRWLAEAGFAGLPVRSVISVGLRLCEALACAHDSNVLHADIKPTNVFVGPTGERAKLADFGIAQILGARERNALVTKLIGTPAYMAPEQKRLGAKIGPWTDVYLLARTLGEFIGGKATRDGAMELPRDAWTGPVVSVLERGLAVDHRQRPKDALEFAALLGDALVAVA